MAENFQNKIEIRYENPFLWITAIEADSATLLSEFSSKIGYEVEIFNKHENLPINKISIKLEKMTSERAIENICRVLGLCYSILYDKDSIPKYVLFNSEKNDMAPLSQKTALSKFINHSPAKNNQDEKPFTSNELTRNDPLNKQDQLINSRNENHLYKESVNNEQAIGAVSYPQKKSLNATPETSAKNNLGQLNNKPYFPFQKN